jgi:hypothetical protein
MEDGVKEIKKDVAEDGVRKGRTDMRPDGKDCHGHSFYIVFKNEPPSITQEEYNDLNGWKTDGQGNYVEEDKNFIKWVESLIPVNYIIRNKKLISAIDFDNMTYLTPDGATIAMYASYDAINGPVIVINDPVHLVQNPGELSDTTNDQPFTYDSSCGYFFDGDGYMVIKSESGSANFGLILQPSESYGGDYDNIDNPVVKDVINGYNAWVWTIYSTEYRKRIPFMIMMNKTLYTVNGFRFQLLNQA